MLNVDHVRNPRISAARRAGVRNLVGVMSSSLVVVADDTSVLDAAQLAEEEGVHHLLVVRGSELVGVLCEYDLLLAGPTALVSECMNVPYCIDAEAMLEDAACLMRERAIGCLPVLVHGCLLGIVTRGDLRRAGLTAAEVAGPVCASCGRDDHVRLDTRTEGAAFCLECRERAFPSESEDDVGGGD